MKDVSPADVIVRTEAEIDAVSVIIIKNDE